MEKFWRHVRVRANLSGQILWSIVQLEASSVYADTEVSQLERAIFSDEKVLRLYVQVVCVLTMCVGKRLRRLNNHLADVGFGEAFVRL